MRLTALTMVPVLALLPITTPASADEDEARYREELSLANNLLATGRAKDSIKIFESANKLAGKKSAECYLGVALAQLRLADFKAARKQAAKALEHAATSHERAEAHYFLGSAFMGLEKGKGEELTAGIAELRHAVEIEPENAVYRYQLGLALVRGRAEEASLEHFERFLELAPGSPRAEEVRGILEYPPRAHPDYAPEFELVTTTGLELSLENQRGRVLLIDFWATWCPPCVDSLPWLRDVQGEFADDPFTLLSVSVDEDEAAWSAFVEAEGMTWEQYRDDGKRIVSAFLPPRYAIPTFVVVDGRGVIRAVYMGNDRKSLRRIESSVEECLKELEAF